MQKLRYEPGLIGGGITGAVMALLVYYKVLDIEAAGLWAVLIAAAAPLAQAWGTRFFTLAVAKVRDAGHDPDRITTDAKIRTGEAP